MASSVKFVFLGATHPHTPWHLRTLQLLDEVSSIVLWDESREALERLQKDRGEKVELITTDLDEALGREDAEFAFVALRNDQTPEAIVRAARSGKHIMSEKPVGINAEQVSRALDEVSKAGVAFGVCYPNRYNPAAQDIRQHVGNGFLGRVMAAEMRLITSQVKFRDPSLWLFKRGLAGGGILSWLGCHYIDLIRYMLDDEITLVSAMVGSLGGEEIEVEDVACLSIRFRKGSLATLQCGYMLPSSRSGYTGASYDSFVGIRGTMGRIMWSPFERASATLQIESMSPEWKASPFREVHYRFEKSEAYGGMYGLMFIRDFIAAAKSGKTPPAGAQDALRAIQVIDAAYESSRTGRWVEVENS